MKNNLNKEIWTKINRLSNKIKAVQFLGGYCKMCGEDNIFVLEFHHKENEIKETTLNILINRRWSKIKKELMKCEVLCSNCHNKLHFNNDKINGYKKIKIFI